MNNGRPRPQGPQPLVHPVAQQAMQAGVGGSYRPLPKPPALSAPKVTAGKLPVAQLVPAPRPVAGLPPLPSVPQQAARPLPNPQLAGLLAMMMMARGGR